MQEFLHLSKNLSSREKDGELLERGDATPTILEVVAEHATRPTSLQRRRSKVVAVQLEEVHLSQGAVETGSEGKRARSGTVGRQGLRRELGFGGR